jgi:hypothetical protein
VSVPDVNRELAEVGAMVEVFCAVNEEISSILKGA